MALNTKGYYTWLAQSEDIRFEKKIEALIFSSVWYKAKFRFKVAFFGEV